MSIRKALIAGIGIVFALAAAALFVGEPTGKVTYLEELGMVAIEAGKIITMNL